MARTLHRLSARECKTLPAGLHADGGNLYLQVTPSGSRSWILRYQRDGKARDMGLGPLHTVTLAEARQAATEARKALLRGDDPLVHRRAVRAARAGVPTFKEAAAEYIETHKAGWKNAKHVAQWTSTLETYAEPHIGALPVDRIETDDVLAVLRPIWSTKTETASRVRMRIEQILAWCAVRRLRPRENPATWRGHLEKLLPKPSDVKVVRHFPALPYADLPAFMAKLRAQPGGAARALEMTILTAARTSMVVGATWSEIEPDVWRIPKGRMKGRGMARTEFQVPIVPALQALLDTLPREKEKAKVLFAGQRKAHLSEGAMDALLERMGFDHVTVHGFRSTFKDWAVETTSFDDIVSEAALAHKIKDKAKAAYQRGALMAKRRELLQAWAVYCGYPKPEGADQAASSPSH